MAVQIPDPGTGNGNSGDNEYVFRKKVQDNFTDQTNAASRLVGTASGNVMQVGAFGLGGTSLPSFPVVLAAQKLAATGFYYTLGNTYGMGDGQCIYSNRGYWHKAIYFPVGTSVPKLVQSNTLSEVSQSNDFLIKGLNATVDGNGFLKGASPVVDLYNDRVEFNNDAEKQDITFEKVATGDYLIKGSLGFAQEGWHIETPKDTNGNVLVAVVEKQLPNKDISIKAYAKRFDEDTGDIVANLTKPRDIPAGRFISLRLHELPTEPTTPME